mgnify:CR=1 FL=1
MGKVLFYGERGIVNGIVLDIKDDIIKQRAFLKAIKFADGSTPEWIDNVTRTDFIVEPSFSEFGNPDLIIIAYEIDNKKHVIFIEAKVCSYEDAAVEKSIPYKNSTTSKINFQLALKFRFVEAFKKCNPNDTIEEIKEDIVGYDDNSRPRRLKNQIIIQMCEAFRDAQDFWFVALTNDLHIVKPYVNPKLLPPIRDCESNWEIYKSRFGLVTYDILEKAGIINRNQGYFGAAAKVFLGLPADIGGPIAGPILRTINRSKWTEEQKAAVKKLFDTIHAATECQYREWDGSYSFFVDGITVIKIFTQNNNNIVLGLRNDGLPEDYKEYLTAGVYNIGVGGNGKSFACAKFDANDDYSINRLSKYAIRYIEKRLLGEESC